MSKSMTEKPKMKNLLPIITFILIHCIGTSGFTIVIEKLYTQQTTDVTDTPETFTQKTAEVQDHKSNSTLMGIFSVLSNFKNPSNKTDSDNEIIDINVNKESVLNSGTTTESEADNDITSGIRKHTPSWGSASKPETPNLEVGETSTRENIGVEEITTSADFSTTWALGAMLDKLGSFIDQAEKGEADTPAKQLFQEFWEWILRDKPLFASHMGIFTYDNLLANYSLESFKQRKEAAETFRLKSMELLETTSEADDRRNLELLRREMEEYIENLEYKGFLMPLNNLEGIQMDGLEVSHFQWAMDYRNGITRFQAFPKQVDEVIGLLQEGIRLGLTPPRIAMDRVPGQIEDILSTPTENCTYYEPFTKISSFYVFNETKTELQEAATQAIEEFVLPAIKKLGLFLDKEYMPVLRGSVGVSAMPGGLELYEAKLRYYTNTNMTSREVHNLGLLEVAKIRNRMQQLIRQEGNNDTFRQFVAGMRDNASFYYDNKEDLLAGYGDILERRIKPVLPRLFKHIPSEKIRIQSMSEAMSGGPAAAFVAGNIYGTRSGVFYVNTLLPKNTPKYSMLSLALHEASPGHHFQESFIREFSTLPHFRRYRVFESYGQAPSVLPMYNSYVEGWALYSEYLAKEVDLYTDLYEELGSLSEEIFRASRLVVDTGMHALGWSREQAIDYMMNNSASSLSNIENEVDRYIAWPGQACSYSVGYLKIKELRRKAENALGSAFDVGDFHDIILHAGPVSRDILEEEVDRYINSVTSGITNQPVTSEITSEPADAA